MLMWLEDIEADLHLTLKGDLCIQIRYLDFINKTKQSRGDVAGWCFPSCVWFHVNSRCKAWIFSSFPLLGFGPCRCTLVRASSILSSRNTTTHTAHTLMSTPSLRGRSPWQRDTAPSMVSKSSFHLPLIELISRDTIWNLLAIYYFCIFMWSWIANCLLNFLVTLRVLFW